MNSAAEGTEQAAWLRSVMEQLQAACCGTAEFDRLVAGVPFPADDGAREAAGQAAAAPSLHCTTDLNHALALLPSGCNFSLGLRDGVFWAWCQPNDDWETASGEARHDHPGGSSLIVAQTAALAVTCAALAMRLRWLETAKPPLASIERPA
jgi:hypothetical protein